MPSPSQEPSTRSRPAHDPRPGRRLAAGVAAAIGAAVFAGAWIYVAEAWGWFFALTLGWWVAGVVAMAAAGFSFALSRGGRRLRVRLAPARGKRASE
jgi:hypothetical protein